MTQHIADLINIGVLFIAHVLLLVPCFSIFPSFILLDRYALIKATTRVIIWVIIDTENVRSSDKFIHRFIILIKLRRWILIERNFGPMKYTVVYRTSKVIISTVQFLKTVF